MKAPEIRRRTAHVRHAGGSASIGRPKTGRCPACRDGVERLYCARRCPRTSGKSSDDTRRPVPLSQGDAVRSCAWRNLPMTGTATSFRLRDTPENASRLAGDAPVLQTGTCDRRHPRHGVYDINSPGNPRASSQASDGRTTARYLTIHRNKAARTRRRSARAEQQGGRCHGGRTRTTPTPASRPCTSRRWTSWCFHQ